MESIDYTSSDIFAHNVTIEKEAQEKRCNQWIEILNIAFKVDLSKQKCIDGVFVNNTIPIPIEVERSLNAQGFDIMRLREGSESYTYCLIPR